MPYRPGYGQEKSCKAAAIKHSNYYISLDDKSPEELKNFRFNPSFPVWYHGKPDNKQETMKNFIFARASVRFLRCGQERRGFEHEVELYSLNFTLIREPNFEASNFGVEFLIKVNKITCSTNRFQAAKGRRDRDLLRQLNCNVSPLDFIVCGRINFHDAKVQAKEPHSVAVQLKAG